MGKHKTLIGLLAVLVVLIGLYFMMGAISDKEAESQIEEDIVVINMGDVSFLEYSDGSAAIGFEKGENGWYWIDDETMVLDQDLVQGIVDDLAYISAVRELEGADELEAYGLDDPRYRVTIADDEGNEVNVYIGDATGDNYYATVDETGVVYTVSSTIADSFKWDITVLEVVEEETEESTDEETTEDAADSTEETE